jgi:tetratricopeptide (TPR) repeat protein
LGAEPAAVGTRPAANYDQESTNQEARLNQQRTTELLALAERQFASKQLSVPPGDNALETYRRILKLAPTHEQALAGIEKTKNQYRIWAQAAAVKKQWAQAEGYLKKGLAIDPKDSSLNTVQRRLQETREAQQLAAARKAQIAATQRSQANQETLSSIRTPGSAQSPEVVRVKEVKHQVMDSRAPTTVSIHAAITGVVERAEVFVASDQGFIPYAMNDDGPHGDSTSGERRYARQITLPDLTKPTRYYVAVYTQEGTVIYSPRHAETEAYLIEAQPPQNPPPSVIISEFMAVNKQTITDPQGDYDDWIELHNTSSAEVDLSDMYLSDDPEQPKKWRFPQGTRLAGQEYLIVWADQEISYTRVSATAVELHANFRLADRGAQILLIDSDRNGNALLDQISFDRQRPDMSMARGTNASEFAAMRLGTPGQAN